MGTVRLPDGFGWTWAGDTVRIDLPRVLRTPTHVLEPVLSRADAEALADAVFAQDRARRKNVGQGSVVRPLARILLAHSPRYTAETLQKFRAKLAMALIERGPKVTIDEMETMSGEDPDPDLGGAA